LVEAHEGIVGGHYKGRATTRKILYVGLWWPKIYKYEKEYAQNCDVCQTVGNPSRRDEIPLGP